MSGRGHRRAQWIEVVRGGLEERIALMAPSRRLRLALAEEVLVKFACKRPIRVLDAGAGDGLLSLSIADRHRDWTVVGMDVRDDLLAGARERAANRGLANSRFEHTDLTRTLPESGFDAVMALECLSEIVDDRQAVRAMVGALRPGGLFVLQVPDQRWKPILPGSPGRWRDEVRHGYTGEELVEMLRDAGLADIALRPTFHLGVAIAQEMRDRVKDSSLALRAALFPLLTAPVVLERHGMAWGRGNALLVVAQAPGGA